MVETFKTLFQIHLELKRATNKFSQTKSFSKVDINKLFDFIALSSRSQIKLQDLEKFAENSSLDIAENLDLALLYGILEVNKDGGVSRLDFERFFGC